MGKGKRYGREGQKLNMKKVVAVLIALIVIVITIIGIVKMFSKSTTTSSKTVPNQYFAVYTNGKWGVINSKGEIIIKPDYEEAIIIPDNTKDLFLCVYDVNYNDGTYRTEVLNSKGEEFITGYDAILPLENYDSNNNLWYEKDVLLVKKDDKYGLIDFKGKELLKCEYDEIETLKGITNSYVAKKDGKVGLVDNIGAVVIEEKYAEIKPVSTKAEDGYIVTDDSKKMGVVKRNDVVAVEIKYDDIKPICSDDKYVVKDGKDWQIIDKDGNTYLKGKFDEVINIKSNMVVIKRKNQYGILTLDTAEEKVAVKYQDMNYAFDDKYIYKENNLYGVMNSSGEVTLKPEYEELIYRADVGFLEGTKKDSFETEFIGTDFTVKQTGILSEINVENGYMKIRTNGEYKYYNFKFEEKSNIELLTTNTLFLSKKDGKYGYVNKDGIVVVNYIYDDAKEQNEFGYASVKKNGMWGCINSKGEEVITPAYGLENNSIIEFIGKWHRGEDLNLNYYTDK